MVETTGHFQSSEIDLCDPIYSKLRRIMICDVLLESKLYIRVVDLLLEIRITEIDSKPYIPETVK